MGSCGGLIRDSTCAWILGFAKSIGVYSVVEAELWGVFTGLSCAWNLEIRNVDVEIDSFEALCFIKEGSKGKGWPGLVLYIMELCARNWSISFRHVHHEGNKVAD
ncbi:hypothetical protein GQ457_04G016990 [Hibiscus cannabinus]